MIKKCRFTDVFSIAILKSSKANEIAFQLFNEEVKRMDASSPIRAERLPRRKKNCLVQHWQLYLMILPALCYILLFSYVPMYGITIAFKKFNMRQGILGSPWIGFANFERLFSSYWFPIILKNTLTISVLSLVIGFPLPIILALMVNEMENEKLKKTFQTVSYAPHFISTIVLCGMITLFLSPNSGILNRLIVACGGQSIHFMAKPGMFKWIYIISGIWQGIGWSTIIFVAALSGVDKELLEASTIDGANILQKIWYINLPILIPTAVILFILRCGSLFSVGYEKVYALQTAQNIMGSEVISTYSYKAGLGGGSDFSFSTTISIFNSVCNSIILITANRLSRLVGQSGLW